MTAYSQKQYKGFIGNSKSTIPKYGCAITSIGIMVDKDPLEINRILMDSNGYADDLVKWKVAAKALNMKYDDDRSKPLFYPTIAMTDHYKDQGFPQHFVVLLGDRTIIDPLDGNMKASGTFNLISYRNISPKDNQPTEGQYMTEDEYREVIDNVVNGWYLNYLNRVAGTFEADKMSHVNSIAGAQTRKYALSDWVNKQKDEPEFVQIRGQKDDTWKIQTINKLKELLATLEA